MQLERDYQPKVLAKIQKMFPGCLIQKLDEGYQQGIPDWLVLYNDRWAVLEIKKSLKDRRNPRPNQEYFVDRLNEMSFSAFIYPENEEEVLRGLQRQFEAGGNSRVSFSE